MKILFEDEYIIVAIKAVGILSQSDKKGEVNMISLLKEHCKGEVYPLHRLDRPVGGVMVYAKNKFAASALSRDIQEHKFQKEYIALVHGNPKEKSGVLEDLLFKDSIKNKSFVVKRERKGVKKASLHYEVIKQTNDLSSILILLHTGRTHQIRVQFSSRKMPLTGDRKYGADDGFETIGLWSYRLTFNHPKTKKELCFSAKPENYINEYI